MVLPSVRPLLSCGCCWSRCGAHAGKLRSAETWRDGIDLACRAWGSVALSPASALSQPQSVCSCVHPTLPYHLQAPGSMGFLWGLF